MRLILELPEDLQSELQALAGSMGLSEEDVTLNALREYLERNVHRSEVQAAGAYVDQKNAELYQRLA